MAEELFRPWTWKAPEGGVIGKRRLGRRDGMDKASGKGLYSHDIYRPGMLYAKVLLSPYPHARIKSMDTSKAEAYPGVWKVLRYDDQSITWPSDGGGGFYGPSAIVNDYAKWYPKPVGALVVGESELAVDEALRLIEIDWEVLPFTLFWNDAAADDAAVLFPELNDKNNLRRQVVIDLGDVEEGMKEADHIITTTWHVDVDTVAGVEGGCCIAEMSGDNSVTLWPHSQQWSPIDLREGPAVLSAFPWLSASKLYPNVHLPYNGATFGHIVGWQSDPFKYAIIAAKATGRPVKFLYDGQHFVGSGEEAGSHTLEIGFKDDGSLTAVKGHTEQCYNFARQMENLEEGCKCENLYCVASYYYDNHGTYSCYKDRGTLTNIVSEVFDQIATALDMDPVDVALVNDGSYGKDMAWLDENVKAQQGFDPTRDSLKECLEIGKAAFDWDSKWHLPGTKILPNGNYHGVAFRWTNAWGHSPSRVATGIRMHKDGTAVLLAQSCDIGVNRNTTYCQVAADELGLKYENVFMQSAEYSGFDTKEPGGSSGLNGTLPGVVGAARKLKQLLLEFALEPLPGSGGFFGPPTPATPSPFEGKTTADLDIKDGLVFEKANPGNTMEVVKLAAAHASAMPNKLFAWDYPPAVTDQKYALGKQLYFMEVEVDPDTGKVYVKKLVIVNDAGKLITPESFEGQQYGGSYMGIGRSNQEEVIWDPNEGVKLTDDLINYPIALMNDCESMEYYQIETGFGYTAYGTFGIGESGGANVCNLTRYAVHNAIGKWVDLKTKPDKILKALGKV